MQHSRTPHSTPRHPHHTFGRISITFNITSNHNHIRSRPLSAMNITFKYRLQFALPHSTHSKPHHAAFQPFRIGIPQPHFTSCISTPLYSPCITPSFNIASPYFTTHLTLHITPYRIYSTSHFIAHHSYIRMNKAQHRAWSGIAKHSTSHQILHHTIPHHCVIWWYWNVCAEPEMSGLMWTCDDEMWHV